MNKKLRQRHARTMEKPTAHGLKMVPSLLDAMNDGNEYESIVSLTPSNDDLILDLKRAVREIESIRNRPCVCYVANVVRAVQDTSIEASDHLPFSEMVGKISASHRSIDVFLATPGGSGEQIGRFVDELRPRFDSVEFLIPYKAMSAGTLWALSGNKIWMDSRAFLGPLDPQVQSKDGSRVPAQALLKLLDVIQERGEQAMLNGQRPPWAMVRLLDQMDQRQLGAAISQTDYIQMMAARYLELYKFGSWHVRSSNGEEVTVDFRQSRAKEVAGELCSHGRWKAHGHAISRDVLTKDLRIIIDRPEDIPGFQRAIRRLWALYCYVFDRTPVSKVILSNDFSFVRTTIRNAEVRNV